MVLLNLTECIFKAFCLFCAVYVYPAFCQHVLTVRDRKYIIKKYYEKFDSSFRLFSAQNLGFLKTFNKCCVFFCLWLSSVQDTCLPNLKHRKSFRISLYKYMTMPKKLLWKAKGVYMCWKAHANLEFSSSTDCFRDIKKKTQLKHHLCRISTKTGAAFYLFKFQGMQWNCLDKSEFLSFFSCITK